MRCERTTGLARLVMSFASRPMMTAAEQWLERTLDDSANRRVSIAEAFLATDGILEIMINVASGMVVYPKVIAARVMSELPFMATENIMMAGVQAGGNRQELHELIRVYSHQAAAQVKQHGLHNDLLDRLKADPAFAKVDFRKVMNPKAYIGRCPEQVNEFIAEVVAPVRRKYRKALNKKVDLKV
jgi:adenylosuccinate lyase